MGAEGITGHRQREDPLWWCILGSHLCSSRKILHFIGSQSVALTVLVPGVQPGPGERSGGHILGGGERTVNKQEDTLVIMNCWLWGDMGC